MKKINFIFFAAVLMFFGFGQKDDRPSKQIDSFIQKQMKEIGIPGAAVAVIQDGKVLHLGTYGIANVEWNEPVTRNTTFQIASVTKLITSTLVMKYIQEGRLHLDDYVSHYFEKTPESWKTIQIRHLLSHQSGIPWPASIGGFLGTKESAHNKVATKEEIFKDLTDSAVIFQPGTKESYMNGDAFLLQMVLEKVGGKPLDQLFSQVIFEPLAMHNSGFDLESRAFPMQVMKPLLQKSQIFTKGKTGPLVFKPFYNPSSYSSGGLYMSIEDAVKWAIALDKADFIHKEIVDQIPMKMPLNGSFTALGWVYENLNGHASYGHSGGPGLGDILRFPEKKLTIIAFSNDADMYPYLAASIALFYFPDIHLPDAPKTLDRGYYKQY